MVESIQGQNKNQTFLEVFVKLKKLKHKKATRLDNLLPGFLRDVAIIITKFLVHVINLSIATVYTGAMTRAKNEVFIGL